MFSKAKNSTILVAVSGGSDSVALLHWLISKHGGEKVAVATVDHQLRAEAKHEARGVAKLSASLGVPHATLVWDNQKPASASSARDARYRLLVQHAKSIGTDTIALGHTMDDQAETLLMRAIRLNSGSDTRGLAGMVEWSSYETVRLWRPLLGHTRGQLQQQLREAGTRWIDDPSNENMKSERVRARYALNVAETDFPPKEEFARLSNLSARTRRWLNDQTTRFLLENVTLNHAGEFRLSLKPHTPLTVLIDVLSVILLIAGGMPHRRPISKITGIATKLLSGEHVTKNIGRCLVKIDNQHAVIKRELRNLPDVPAIPSQNIEFDGRFTVQTDSGGVIIEQHPFIGAMERFRPECDDCLYQAVMRLLRNPVCST